MKRTLLAAAASLMLIGSVATPALADQPGRGHQNDTRYNQHDDRNDGRHGNTDWRDNRPNQRYDASQHNGYYVKNVWHFGAPPSSAYRDRTFQLGYHAWRKGDRLGDFNQRYVAVDYRARHLKAPPRGYHYVQDDSGDIILAAIAGGLIASIIASH